MSLSVLVKSASGLPNVERFSKSDPMTVCTLQGQKKKTKVIENNLDPVWNETLMWDCPGGLSGGDTLKVEVFDHETVGKNRILGTTDVSLQDVVSKGKQNATKTLTGKKGDQLNSKIILELTYTAPAGGGGGGGGHDDDDDDDDGEGGGVGGGDDGGDAGDAGGDGGEAGGEEGGEEGEGGGAGSGSTSSAGSRRKKSKRKAGAQRDKLPKKQTDFQVRVHVHEARKLVGSGLNPITKVICGQEGKETSTQKGTNSPDFNDVLFFNFRCLPDEMFDKLVEIKVLNAKKVLRDSLIGSFKLDLGMVYDEGGHCFIHKWLLLTDPEDTAGGAKGYLKISMQVIGPGDEPKTPPEEVSQETVDIEANLLRPSGVRLVASTLTVRIFRGEDLPQMDAGYFDKMKKLLHVGTVQKELVDPYCTVSFAGHKGKTKVIWNEQDPEWNAQLNLGIRFPSMSERLRFQMKDKDKVNKDDFIGTTFLNMSQISAPGETGFLPTFGPCFINCYGSPREFTDLPDKFEYLNKGLIDGVAYRGRVMVEIDMTLGELPSCKVEEIKIADQKRITNFLRRRKYKLFGAFFSATLIHPNDSPIEFEVSIGNYGNKLDENSPAQPSTTPPSNPIYDGTGYYYLPWVDQKPCVQVDSQWEDCLFRIEALNLLLFMVDSVAEGISSIKEYMKMGNYENDVVRSMVGEILDKLSESLDQSLPDLPTHGFTKLDKLVWERRGIEWTYLQGDVDFLRREMGQKSHEDLLVEVEDIMLRLKALANEPQNCIPDVIVWMLAGNKRVAVKRIPSNELMYSSIAKARGKYCGKLQVINLTPPAVKKQEELEDLKDRAQVRLMLWLGLEKDQTKWTDNIPGGDLATFAETFENEACLFGRWGTTGLTRPNWCDSRGKLKQPKEAFEPAPPGWRWEGDWVMSPELSIAFEPDEGLDEWTEDVFEYQLRYPLGHWPEAVNSYWADVRGDKLVEYDDKKERALSRDDIKCPEGWLWKEEWKIDVNRAVDEDGWEYAVEAGLAAWVPYERNIHLSRRRRWVRLRNRDKDSKILEKKRRKREKAIAEGWEYARLAHLTYHISHHRLDFARRRRWIRKLISTKPGERAVFSFKGKAKKKKKKSDDDDEEEDVDKQQVPRMYLTFKDCHTYQLRAYIYQARDMYASDKSGLSDPYALMTFTRYCGRSRTVKESVCPTWDQTLLLNQIRMFGDPNTVLESPPPVVLEFFDKDLIGDDEYLGSSTATPTVRLSMDIPGPRLDWFQITRYGQYAGELLAGFELLLDEGGELPFTPPKASPPHVHYIVPSGIRPILQKTRVEILCWGVRDMKRYQLLQVTSPLVEMECGGTVVRSEHIKNTKENPNFPKPVISFDVYLPKEELYSPPLNIRILDKRNFGRLPMVGTHIIKSLKDFHVSSVLTPEEKAALKAAKVAGTPTVTPASSIKDLEETIKLEEGVQDLNEDPDSAGKFDYDWWSKYYYSIGDDRRTQKEYVEKGYDRLVVYPTELEENFNRFMDLTQNFSLFRGKGSRDPDEQANQSVGYFKGGIKMYPLPDDGSPEPDRLLSNIPSTDPVDVVVRVYIIKGIDLQPQDPNGKSDPYLKVSIGKKKCINDKANYVTACLNPTFGKMFELPAKLPIDHTLTVAVMDWDRFSADDLIGETKIDLENRFLSQYRPTCGLPETMSRVGPNKWRDPHFPVQILDEWVKSKNFPEPEWSPDKKTVTIDGEPYTLAQFENNKPAHDDLTDAVEQRLALHVLRQQGLVPEHVETRNLYNPIQPGISQGQLHMWVDILRKDFNIPDPVTIKPRQPNKYVLRVVVWNTSDVVLDEVSVATGEAMSDIYVKGWVRGEDETQKTDVHYRSMDGEGNFNWRLIFPFEYLPAENIIVVKKKDHFYSLTKTERHLPPIFTLQIWDNDLFNPDDFIGTVDFNLSHMPLPVSSADDCTLAQLPTADAEVKTDDLFKRKRMKGWWPAYEVDDEGNRLLNGKMELEFEILTEEESQLRPAAKARDEPNMNPVLEPPNRPATSFLWFTSPWKTFKFIIWKFYKWHIIGTIVVILLVVIIVIFVYTAPSTIMTWLTDSILP